MQGMALATSRCWFVIRKAPIETEHGKSKVAALLG
jgi:hypothetical protein